MARRVYRNLSTNITGPKILAGSRKTLRFHNCRKQASLTMSAVSSTFRAHYCMHSEKSAISLSLKVLLFPTVGSL